MISHLNVLSPRIEFIPMGAVARDRALATARLELSTSDERQDLVKALSSFQWFDATHPRDKVYGVINLVRDAGIIAPDYNASPRQCYKDAARRILLESGNLDILDHVVLP